MTNASTTTSERALDLLGKGISAEIVASALGVTTSAISQLAADPVFAARVTDLRYKNLSKHNERDEKYDSLEDSLIEKLQASLGMVYQPALIAKLLQTINMAKRRGASSPDISSGTRETIPLIMPTALLNHFSQNIQVNIHNQVIKAGEQDLVTVQSLRMDQLSKELEQKTIQERINYVLPHAETIRSHSDD